MRQRLLRSLLQGQQQPDAVVRGRRPRRFGQRFVVEHLRVRPPVAIPEERVGDVHVVGDAIGAGALERQIRQHAGDHGSGDCWPSQPLRPRRAPGGDPAGAHEHQHRHERKAIAREHEEGHQAHGVGEGNRVEEPHPPERRCGRHGPEDGEDEDDAEADRREHAQYDTTTRRALPAPRCRRSRPR